MDGMMIPFIMLLIITIALLLERKHHEDKIVDIYEKKFDEWKEHATLNDEPIKSKPPVKELVGLVFLDDEKINIELLNNKVEDRLQRNKYTIVPKG
jgi:hypothetical protein